jgi:uncharacterized protein YfaS (alpha-2-macroglobulin family)
VKKVFLSVLLLCVSPLFAAESTANISSFSPQGTIKDVRQVRVQFSESMIAFGDPATAEPFSIQCPVPGKGIWEDDKNWVYDFKSDLPAGINCSFTLKKDYKTLAKKPLQGQKVFEFSTGGPAISSMIPHQGSSIYEDQHFVLLLDAEPDAASVELLAYFKIDGVEEKVPVQIVSGQTREEILKTVGNQYGNRFEKQYPLVLHAKRKFPASNAAYGVTVPTDPKVHLVWPKGIATKSGVKLEAEKVLTYSIRPAFSATFSCERERAESDCIPLAEMSLQFNSEVSSKLLNQIVLKSGKKTWKPKTVGGETAWGVKFLGPWPALTEFILEIPSVKDEDGRTLRNASSFPLKVKTADYPPLAKFASNFGILELNAQPTIPVTLRNIEPEVKTKLLQMNPSAQIERLNTKMYRTTAVDFAKVVTFMAKLDDHTDGYEKRDQSIFEMGAPASKIFQLKKPNGPKAFEVMGIPAEKPGFYLVEIESPKLGESLIQKKGSYFIKSAALVTNMVVHFKAGRESSAAWVTSLDKGEPVADALVSIRNCNGEVRASGKSNKQGMVKFASIYGMGSFPSCKMDKIWSEYASGYYVVAEKEGDFTFTHSSWNSGIENYRFSFGGGYSYSPQVYHTVFDRTLLRAGETVHMKHIAREFTSQNIVFTSEANLPKSLIVMHSGTQQAYNFPLKWNKNQTAVNEWKIPQEAKLGTYYVSTSDKTVEELNSKKSSDHSDDEEYYDEEGGDDYGGDYYGSTTIGSFRVEEFRLPLMKASIFAPKDPVINASLVPVNVRIDYLSGGPANELDVQLRYQTESMGTKKFEMFDGINFGEPAPDRKEEKETPAKTIPAKLDKVGVARFDLELPKQKGSSRVTMELEYSDPNGQIQTVSSNFPRYESSRLIGLKFDGWMAKKEKFNFAVAVVDLKGQPIAKAPVEVSLNQIKTYSHRKKIVGGFYSYENKSETKNFGNVCTGETDEKGYVYCEANSPVAGNLFLQAQTKDSGGNVAQTNQSFWLYDREPWMFEVSDSDRIELLPEKKRYENGEVAKFQVRMPYSKATVLVTVEREGVIDSFVTKITREKSFIEVPIKPNYSPNIFVSALVVRGRIGDVQPTALVDLGKPTFKLGIAEIYVGWKPHELNVQVTPEKDEYRTREKAKVKITVKTSDGRIPAPNTEVALAVVDEALLELSKNKSWDLLAAMMKPRGYEVKTITAQMQVVGRRHYGLKALPPGGGGGRNVARELFDTLLLWSPNVKLNANGEATVDVPLNDSLTSFKAVAVVNAGSDRFGTGDSSIRTFQPVSIFSGIPPVAREGDVINAEITLKNGIMTTTEIDLVGKINGVETIVTPSHVSLKAGESTIVKWNIVVPTDKTQSVYEIEARDADKNVWDKIKTTQTIKPAVPVQVVQATIQQVEQKSSMKIEQPKDSLPGRGGIRQNLSASLVSGLDPARRYMAEYPYRCLEQRASKSIVLEDQKEWDRLMGELPTYLDGDGLARYFTSLEKGSDALTAYLLSIAHESGMKLPQNSQNRMIEGLTLFVEGKITRGTYWQAADLTFRKIAAMHALSRWNAVKEEHLRPYSDPAAMTTWPTSTLIDMYNIAKRFAKMPNRDQVLAKTSQALRSRLNFRGTIMGFSTEGADGMWWLMVSTDLNANTFLLSVLEDPSWKSDVPRLVNGIIARQKRGHWDLTTANAWGAVAIRKFSNQFEKTPVTGKTKSTLVGQTSEFDWAGKSKEGKLEFTWPAQAADLTTVHSGAGKPWVTTQSLAAVDRKEPFFKGFQIEKTITAVQQKKKGAWSKGDVIRISLNIDSQADMGWVVVNDPVPAGATILGSGLGRDSKLLISDEKQSSYPIFIERAFDAYRAYYGFVRKGKWKTEYTLRLNQGGSLSLPATRVEAMYAPEIFGELPNAKVVIAE